MKRVLVTGGFGYLGGRIAVELVRDPKFIVRLGSRKNQPVPQWLPKAEIVKLDVLDLDSLQKAMADVQAVVHLAAMNESECLVDPGKAILINTLGTWNVLQAAIKSQVERFIYFSTAHVYGAPLVGHISENTLPRPIHPYAITHHAAEDHVLAAHDQKKIIGIVLRLSNGFGAPIHTNIDRWTLLVNDLCCQLVQTGQMVLKSSGLQQRDFIPLEDVARAVRYFLRLTRVQCEDGLFNLGAGLSLSVWEMAQRIKNRCQSILGFSPLIICAKPSKSEAEGTELVYSIGKLKKSGFLLNGNLDVEVDNLLRLCRNFKEV